MGVGSLEVHGRGGAGIRTETEAMHDDVPLAFAGFQGKGGRDIGDDAGGAEFDPLRLAGTLDVPADSLVG